MTASQIVTLIIAILGVLHGPLIPALLAKRKNAKASR